MKRRGVVMVFALVAMGLSATLLTTLAQHASGEVTRTAMEMEDAQISQLIAAGMRSADVEATVGKFDNGQVAAPVGQISITWEAASGTTRSCTIDASFGKTQRSVAYTPSLRH